MESIHIRQGSEIIHFFYKTINLINGNFYYGVHSTKNINDGYYGSGLLIEKAIKRHGKENFKRLILKQFQTRNEAYKYESEIVNSELLKNRKCYNRAPGGQGGFLGKEAIEKMRKSKLGKPTWNAGTARPIPNCLDCSRPMINIYAKRCKKCSLTSNLNPACKNRSYVTPNGVFKTKAEAAKANNLTPQSFSRRLISDPNNYKVQK